MPTKAKRLTSIALIFILIIPLFTVLIPLGYAGFETDRMQLREHRRWGGAAMDCVFSINANVPFVNSGVASFGNCYYFIVFPRALLAGNRINFTTSALGTIQARAFFQDGAYNREVATDWPFNADLPIKGAGKFDDIINGSAWTTEVNSTVFNYPATEQFVTLFFEAQDNSFVAGQGIWVFHVSVQSGVAVLFEQNYSALAEAITMEVSGTNEDYGYVEFIDDDLDFCFPIELEIENPSARAEDGTPWVFTETKFYFFNVTYGGFNLTGGDVASIRFSPDGTNNVVISYTYLNDINGLLSVSDPEDFVTVPSVARNFTGARFNSTSEVLWVNFPIWFTNNAPDAQNVDIFWACTGLDFSDSGEDFHIYNQGGLVEKSDPVVNASFIEGGDWFEMCANTTLDTFPVISANQTWRKLQHFQLEYALHFYHTNGTPEDQFMQDAGHIGGIPPETVWAAAGEWFLRFKIFGYDNVTSAWFLLNQITMNMDQGNEGANDEWIRIRTQIDNMDPITVDGYWNAFIEEEPAARFRTWLDMWVNKINASSVIGDRTNAYYFGMDDSGYLFWANWAPMIDNTTEVIGFKNILDGNLNVTQARNYDLMKINVELATTYLTASHNYTVCIEEVNINEVQLASLGEELSGVNTPIFIAPKVPDMPIGGILAPLYAAITRLGETLWSALTGILGIAWDAIAQQFPWFTQFIEDAYSMVIAFTQFLETIVSSLVDLLDFIAGLFWLFPVITGAIGDTWALITSWLDPFVANAGDWILLAVIVFGIIPFAANVSEGRIKEVRADIETVWGFLSTILDWAFRLAKMVVDIILGFIPG